MRLSHRPSWRTLAPFALIAFCATSLVSTPRAEAQLGVADSFIIHAHNEAIGATSESGAITTLSYSTSTANPSASLIHQGTPGVPGGNETGDFFGVSTAVGDFNGDGQPDLAVSSPGEAIGSIDQAGAVTILYSSVGSSFSSAALFHQGSAGVPGANEAGDLWGIDVAAGDVNNDGYDDLVVGAPFEDIGSIESAGAITVLFGGSGGLTGAGSKSYHQGSPGVPGANETGDGFGYSVAVAGTGSLTYLAVGAHREDIGAAEDSGSVTLFGTDTNGLVPASPALYPGAPASGVRPALPGGPGNNESFGFELAGHPNGLLAIGSPFSDVDDGGLQTDAGYVTLYAGFYDIPVADIIFQNVAGSIESGNRFGFSLDIEVVNGVTALAVGTPDDTIDGQSQAGSVTIISFSVGATQWSQNSPGVPGVSEVDDFFGNYVDLLPNGDLFVGTPGEDIGSQVDTGAGTVIFGATSGNPTFTSVHQNSAGFPGSNETNDRWGL